MNNKTVKIKTTLPNAKSSTLQTSMGVLEFDEKGMASMEDTKENRDYVKRSPLFHIAKELTPAQKKVQEVQEAQDIKEQEVQEALDKKNAELKEKLDKKISEYTDFFGEEPGADMTIEDMDKAIAKKKEDDEKAKEKKRAETIKQVKSVLNLPELQQIAEDNPDKIGKDAGKLDIDALIDLLLSNNLIDLGESA